MQKEGNCVAERIALEEKQIYGKDAMHPVQRINIQRKTNLEKRE
jgi:hypothetical protein